MRREKRKEGRNGVTKKESMKSSTSKSYYRSRSRSRRRRSRNRSGSRSRSQSRSRSRGSSCDSYYSDCSDYSDSDGPDTVILVNNRGGSGVSGNGDSGSKEEKRKGVASSQINNVGETAEGLGV